MRLSIRFVGNTLRRTLPNAVTVSRLVLAIGCFVLLAAAGGSPGPVVDRHAEWGIIACVMFAVAAATDALDGYLARAWEVVSPFGRVMDPFCDKFLILGALVLLASGGLEEGSGVHAWMVLAILGRELLVTSMRAVAESMGHPFPAEASGKWKMALQCFAIGTAIVAATRQPLSDGWTHAASLLMWAATLFTLATLIPYGIRGVSLLSAPANQPGREA